MQSAWGRFGVGACAALAFMGAGVFVGRECDVDAEPEPLLEQRSLPVERIDAQLFRDVRDGLQAYRMIDVPIGTGDLRLLENPQAGLIQSAWFPVHKGESEHKVQIAVWGSFYRIDVWARSVLTGKLVKTDRSRGAERAIQESIEALRHSRGAAVNSGARPGLTAPPKTSYARETSSSSTRGSVAAR